MHDVHEGISNAMSLQKQRTGSLGETRPSREPSKARTVSKSDSLQRAASAAQRAADAEPAEGDATAQEGATDGGQQGKPGSAGMSVTSRRTMTPETDLAAIDTDKIEDVSSEDWGLDMLVKVGEAWASSLLTMTPCAPSSPHFASPRR